MPGTATTILIDGTPTDGSDPWIDSLVTGGAWKDSNGGTVTIQWTAFQGTMDGQNSYSWTSLALTALREALSLWESVANIDFVEVNGAANADVKFWLGTEGQADGALGWSDLPGFSDYYEFPASETRDVLFNAEDSSMYGALDDGGLGLVTMVHEIGHLLGLAHPHDGGAGEDGTLFPGVDFWDPYDTGDGGLNQGVYTTMSYTFGAYGSTSEAYGLQYGPMALDIAAIQAIYGANTNYASGNSVYRLPTVNDIGIYWKSIWDTGGVDTISGEGATGSVTIDLRPAMEGMSGGGWLSSASDYFGVGIQGGFTIARGVVIENAIGSDNFDTLIGNAASNRLEGGKGWDSLDGGAGADIMIGGEGQDTYYVDNAGDVIVELPAADYEFGNQTDTVYSTAANYTLSANIENLTLQGTASINGKGNSSGNVITGNSGDNILESGGNDRDGYTEFLYGVGFTDFLYGLGGNDRLVLTNFVNYMVDGGTGTDTVALGGAGMVLDIASQSVASRLENMERVDLTGTGNNVLVVNQASVLGGIGAAVGSKYVLVVEGNAGDQLHFLESNWTKTGSLAYPEGTFDRWEFGSAQVHVKQGLSIQMPHSSSVTVLSSLNGSNGFKLSGGSTDIWIGCSVASAGDINGDGYDDVIVGSMGPSTGVFNSGASYVVFGKASGFAANIDLPALNGTDGFKLSGVAAGDLSGRSVASAGDVNGDGFADLIIGGPDADPTGAYSGASYVVFGKAAGFGANFNLSTLNGSNGFRLIGAEAYDRSGWSVASAGDFNGDGFDDVIVGARQASATYIVYGKASGFTAAIDLSTLNANTGLELADAASNDTVGFSVASAGDVNGDGYDDVIVGAPGADPNGPWSGTAYVVFGRASGISASLDLASLNGSNGFRLDGLSESNQAGFAVASAGDLNGDGFADLIVGAPDIYIDAGASFVVFGKASGFSADIDLSALNGTNGFRLNGRGASVASAGDFNGDGFADLIVANSADDTNGSMAGATFVMFGGVSGFAASLDLAALNGDRGLRIAGAVAGGSSGEAIASAGDVNGDGYDDLIIGALGVLGSRGASYVVFGGAFGGSTTPVTTIGTVAAEILLGGRGNDVLTGGGGGDVFHGGAGNDRMTVKDLAFHRVDGGTGTDTLVLGGAGLSLDLANPLVAAKLEGIERIDLTGAGNNTLIVSQLSVLGGIGSVAGGKHILVVERNFGDTVQFVEANWAKAGSVTNADGTFDRWVLGNAEVHVELVAGVSIVGTSGNDIISTTVSVAGQPLATPLDDVIDGRAGADTMAGGLGDDAYIVDNVGDQVIELAGGGTDLVRSSASTWTLGDNVENLILTGTNSINGTGNGSNNILTGNIGNNLLDGGAGADAMAGGLGDDTYVVDSVGDLVTEGVGEGTDTVNAWLGWTLGANLEQLRLMGTADLNGIGNNLSNALFGNAGNNDLNGGAGADTMSGGAGNDTYVVDDSGDVVVEAAGGGVDIVHSSVSWTLGANIERLALSGVQAINGTGNEMNNALTGNAANNVLDGGLGADSMTGGLGNDSYFVDSNSDAVIEAENAGIDTVHATASYRLSAHVEKLVLLGVAHLNGTGNDLANALTGNAGDNILDGGLGADTMSGGLGNDTYLVDSNSDAVIEAADAGIDTVRATVSYRLAANVEKLALLGTDNLSGTGNELANVLTGNAGDNTLDGGLGADTMTGGLGNDTYLVEASDDLVIEGSAAGIDLVRATANYRLSNNVENLTLLGAANLTATGNGLANSLTGNAGHNTLDGGLGADTMAGGLGDDAYLVDAAGDVVSEAAGGGFDTVQAWVSHTLSAHVEALTLMGSGDLEGIGNTLANTLSGNAGRNLLDGGAGADTMAGGAGNDRYIVDNVGDVVIEAAAGGLDTVQSSVTYALGANVENLVLAGTGALSATGNALANNLTGNAGRNTLDGGLGADTMSGGLGDDTYVVDASGDIVIEAENAGVDAVLSTMSYSLSANIERLTLLGAADLTGTGNALANVLAGNAGNNTLDGGLGADKMSGSLGDDTYVVDINTDVVVEAADAGIDTVRATANYRLAANVEKLTLLGTANLLGFGNELANVLTGNAGNNTLDGAAAADTMAGGAGNDVYVVDDSGDVVIEAAAGGNDMVQAWASHVLAANVEGLKLMGTTDLEGTGNTLANALFGNSGKNILDGGAGADTMTGGAGDDTYIVDHASDRVVETAGGGSDTVRSSITYTLSGGIETLILTGSAAVGGKGNAENNALIGNGANNGLDGGAGVDTMIGGDGNDIYVIENAGDVVIEMANGGADAVRAWIDYTLTDNVETLTLYGTADIDATGNALANTLTGNSGRNVLDGGLGADVLIGASGDSFRYSTGLGADNVDRIARFEHTANMIELDHTIFATLGIGTLDAGAFNTGAVSTQADDRILFHASSQALYYDADGAGGAAAVKFASIGVLVGTLDHTDFLIV